MTPWTDDPPLRRATPASFTGAFRQHAAAVAVVTFRAPGVSPGEPPRPWGFTATSVVSLSAEPPVLGFALDRASSCATPLARAATVAVSLLGADQARTAARFATRGRDRFADDGWTVLGTGEPVIVGARAWLRGVIIERLPAGGSTFVVAEAVEVARSTGSRGPLLYHDRKYFGLGSEHRF